MMFKNIFFTHKSAKYIFLSIVTLTSTLSYAEHRKHNQVIQTNLNLQNYSIFKPITLDEISKLAINNKQDLESFDYLIEANWHAERAALGAFLPQITIVVDSGKSSVEELSGISQYPRESITLDASQLIFSLGGPKIKYQMAKEETKIAIAQKETLKNSIRFDAEGDFLTLKKELLRNQLIKILDDSSKLTFDQYKTKEKVGFLNKAQWANSQAIFSKDQTNVTNYPSNINIATKVLERKTNIQVDPNCISLDTKNLENIKLLTQEEYLKYAMENRPDLKEKNHQITQANYSTKYYKYKYVPEIYLTTHVQKAKMVQCPPAAIDTIPFDNTPLIWHVGLNATWNFDGLSNFNTSKQYDDLSTSYILKKRDIELNILKDIQALRSEIDTQIELLKPTTQKMESAKIELDNIKTQYDIGLTPLYKYKEAQLAFNQADFELTSLKIDLKINNQKLLFLCGYPQEISN